MTMYDIIYKKREGEILSKLEIEFFIAGLTKGEIPDYQAAALLMAIFFRGMNKQETFDLTDAMRRSGDIIDLSGIHGIKVDKHSSGGVGDKTTLIVGPLAAACGIPVAKMSGRGLGFTGGTVDKMEAIPGFRTALSEKEFIDVVNRVGLSVIGQTAQIAKADKLLYALRDVTATVDNISLITASIMSKKLASGSDAIVLDVKCGGGAFMEDLDHASKLAELMVEIGKTANKRMAALITDMSQPLGFAVGNSLEVMEAIDVLKGTGPQDITDLSLQLASYMVYLGGIASSPEAAHILVEKALNEGAALNKLRLFIEGQGGNSAVVDDITLFPQPSYQVALIAQQDGYVTSIDARTIGFASQQAGAGREKKEDRIDLSAGVQLRKKTGDRISKGEHIGYTAGNDQGKVEAAARKVLSAIQTGKDPVEPIKLIKQIIL